MFNNEADFSFKRFFHPLTTRNAVYFIIIVDIIIYSNSLFGAFVADDKGQVQFNYAVQSLKNILIFFSGSTFIPANGTTELVGPFYKPLLSLTYAFLYVFFGATPFFFHALQLSLHIFNGILVFLLFKTFFKEKLAFFLALIFLVHPINSESVVYIADLQEPLFFAFGISALMVSLKKNISLKRGVLISFLLLCSLLSKETGILFFIIILINKIIFTPDKRQLTKTIFVITLPILIYGYLRFSVAKIFLQKVPGMPIAEITFMQRVLTMPAIVFYYLKTFFYPFVLNFFQQWVVKDITIGSFYIPLLLDVLFFIAVIFLGIFTYKKRGVKLLLPFVFFISWFFIGIGFHLQIIPLDLTVSDRWFYFPIVGLLGILGIFFQSFPTKFSQYKNLGIAVGIVILCLFSLRTMIRNTNWSDEITLFTHELHYSESDIIENNLGLDYIANHDYDDAIIHLKKSVAIKPGFINLYDLASAYMAIGDLKKAEAYFLQAVAYKNAKDYKLFSEKLFQQLSTVYILSHQYSSAEKLATHVVKDYPHDGLLWENLAVSQYLLGDNQSALHAITQAKKYLQNDEVQYIDKQISTNQPIHFGNI
ncbi:MAG TPA: hypothetical protein VLF89_04425 [Candidatus Saccharimonadales bacterium]|nr:hypothetical protein [Candidatus Saccharimonadales bacterium]